MTITNHYTQNCGRVTQNNMKELRSNVTLRSTKHYIQNQWQSYTQWLQTEQYDSTAHKSTTVMHKAA